MPRFFFDVYDEAVTPDEEGQVLPNLACAIEEARREALALACAELETGEVKPSHRIQVADESGQIVAVAPFRQTVEIDGY